MPHPDNFSDDAFNRATQPAPEIAPPPQLDAIRVKVAELSALITELGNALYAGQCKELYDAQSMLTETLQNVEYAVKADMESQAEYAREAREARQ